MVVTCTVEPFSRDTPQKGTTTLQRYKVSKPKMWASLYRDNTCISKERMCTSTELQEENTVYKENHTIRLLFTFFEGCVCSE